MPQTVRGGLHNVLDNLGGPVTVANNLLQAQFEDAAIATGASWSTPRSGVAGIFDVATDWGMPARNRDFGETMGTYGVPPGPIWCCRCAAPPMCATSPAIISTAMPRRCTMCVMTGATMSGWMKSTLGSMDNRADQHRHLSRHRARQRGLLRHHAHPLYGAPGAADRGPPGPHRGIAGLLSRLLRRAKNALTRPHDGR